MPTEDQHKVSHSQSWLEAAPMSVLLRKLHRALEISQTISGNNRAFPVRLLYFPDPKK